MEMMEVRVAVVQAKRVIKIKRMIDWKRSLLLQVVKDKLKWKVLLFKTKKKNRNNSKILSTKVMMKKLSLLTNNYLLTLKKNKWKPS